MIAFNLTLPRAGRAFKLGSAFSGECYQTEYFLRNCSKNIIYSSSIHLRIFFAHKNFKHKRVVGVALFPMSPWCFREAVFYAIH